MNNGTASSNAALADELEALTSIYEADTLVLHDNPQQSTSASASSEATTTGILRLPDSEVSFLISFPVTYPDVPPSILGTQSTGAGGRRGQGEAAVSVLRDTLARIYVPGQVCLFDLVEEAGPLLLLQKEKDTDGAVEDYVRGADDAFRSVTSSTTINPAGAPVEAEDEEEEVNHPDAVLDDGDRLAASSPFAPPNWTLSESLTVNKSTFIARACRVDSLAEAHASLAHLLASNKKVASATHNISAWRMRIPPPPSLATAATASSRSHSHSNPHHHNHHHQSPPTPTTVSAAGSGGGATATTIIQDSDDDGETAAGGRLLHLLQLMDAWNVLVVVTRWYGGVKLGPDRFRLINSVAREAVLRGGFARDKDADKDASSADKDKDKKGKNAGGKGGRR